MLSNVGPSFFLAPGVKHALGPPYGKTHVGTVFRFTRVIPCLGSESVMTFMRRRRLSSPGRVLFLRTSAGCLPPGLRLSLAI